MIGITERGDPAFDTSWIPWVASGKPAILISKRPQVIHAQLIGMNRNVIVHATITGYGGSMVEPNVPSFPAATKGYDDLVDLLGKDRVVLRIDPIIPTEKGIKTAKEVLSFKRGTRVRISFIDNYDHVKLRLEEEGLNQLPWNDFHAPLELRKKIWKEMGEPEVCGEPGFECIGCVSKRDCEILGVEPKKVGNQREACTCLTNKKELLKSKGQCFHKCTYCYWR